MEKTHSSPPAPPRAFAQGVGTVFQFFGVFLFLGMMLICCGSGLLSREWATREELRVTGWGQSPDASAEAMYSAQRAITLSVTCGVFFGIALAGIGLGLQAQHRRAPLAAALLTCLATMFWVVQTVFTIDRMDSIVLRAIAIGMSLSFAGLLILSIGAMRDMSRHPPPADLGILPADYAIPYSHLHQEPPEIRLAKELVERRARLATQQKELELLEEKLRKHRKSDE